MRKKFSKTLAAVIHVVDVDRLAYIATITLLLLAMFVPQAANAAQITGRKTTLSSSSAAGSNATTTYTFNFTVPSATVLQSYEAIACTTASGSCTIPTGFSVSAGPATLSSQPTNLGDASGWTVNTATAGKLRIKKTGNVAAPTGSQTVVFGNVQNPTTANLTYFLRMTTYSDDAWTTPVDTGVIAVSTAEQITVSASVDETLTFCIGQTGIVTDCSAPSGNSVSLGTLSASSTGTGTSQIGATTNAVSGYSITYSGATLFKNSANSTTSFQVQPSASSTPVLNVDTSNARVGVGTASPAEILDVKGTVDATTIVFNSEIASGTTSILENHMGINNGGVLDLIVSQSAASAHKGIPGNTAGIASTWRALIFSVTGNGAGAERMRISTGGNVGIGNDGPSKLLHVGKAGTTLGVIGLDGSTSGTVTVQPAAAAGTWTLTLPTGAGSSGQVLQTNGSGTTSWENAPSTSDYTQALMLMGA